MLLVLFATQQPVHAIEDLRLQIEGTNIVLSWPSIEGETFIVRYRARLDEALYEGSAVEEARKAESAAGLGMVIYGAKDLVIDF